MPSDLCETRRSSSAALSGSTAGDTYEGPDANTLTALLLEEKKPGPADTEVQFDSRESTPFVMLMPPGVEHWRSVARAAKENLALFIGKPAAEEIRRSIPYMHYWKTEAEHYAQFCSVVAGASADQMELLRQTTTEDLRGSILDIHYWETEAMHYQRHTGGVVGEHKPAKILGCSMALAKQPTGVRKNTKASHHKAKGRGKDAPVSTRLRSRTKAITKKGSDPKSGQVKGRSRKASILSRAQRPRRR